MKNKIQKVSFVGNGNVGSHLIEALRKNDFEVTHILVRSTKKYNESNLKFISDYTELPNNQLTFVCVPDDEIVDVIQKIDQSNPIAYTSGSVSLSEFENRKEIGVFYPLQTFTRGIDLDLKKVPFFIESNSTYFGEQLFDIAKRLSNNVKYANSEQRAKLHLAAVWVNNFTNHINFIAKDYLDTQEMDFDDLIPLLQETVKKIVDNSPQKSQTGPANRGDRKTIEKHLMMLPEQRKELYLKLSESIIKTYSKDDKL